MLDLIVVAGAPGSGKSTISKRLAQEMSSPYVELGRLREFHLDPWWTRANRTEEQMAFENMVSLVQNYKKYGYSRVIISDLEEEKVALVPKIFSDLEFMIVTLVVADPDELKRRVLLPDRDSGFRDWQKALEWNQGIVSRGLLPKETKIDNTLADTEKTVQTILGMIRDA